MRKALTYCLPAVGVLVFAAGLWAQNSGLTRTIVGRADVSVAGREAVVARVEVAPGGRSGRHTHPGDEISYVLEGQGQLILDGQPPRVIRAGESSSCRPASSTTPTMTASRRSRSLASTS